MDDYFITSRSFRERTASRFYADHERSYKWRLDNIPSHYMTQSTMCPSLTILIPSCKKHKDPTDTLCKELSRQRLQYIVDDREDVDLGTKRQDLYKQSKTEYSIQWDADDWISGDFSIVLHKVLELSWTDCINFIEHAVLGDQTTVTRKSMNFPWQACKLGDQYAVSPTPKSIIATALAQKVTFEKGHMGEDLAFARDLRPLLKTETNLEYIGYYYEYSDGSCTKTNEHQIKEN